MSILNIKSTINSIVPNIRKGGNSNYIGDGISQIHSFKKKTDDVLIGNNLAVDDKELIRKNGKYIEVLSHDLKLDNDKSPVEEFQTLVSGGVRPALAFNSAFKHQENYKNKKGINDDGTHAVVGIRQLISNIANTLGFGNKDNNEQDQTVQSVVSDEDLREQQYQEFLQRPDSNYYSKLVRNEQDSINNTRRMSELMNEFGDYVRDNSMKLFKTKNTNPYPDNSTYITLGNVDTDISKFASQKKVTTSLINYTKDLAKKYNLNPYELLSGYLIEGENVDRNGALDVNTYYNMHNYQGNIIGPTNRLKTNVLNKQLSEEALIYNLKQLGLYQENADGTPNLKTPYGLVSKAINSRKEKIDEKVKENMPDNEADKYARWIFKYGWNSVNPAQKGATTLAGKVKNDYETMIKSQANKLAEVYPDLFSETYGGLEQKDKKQYGGKTSMNNQYKNRISNSQGFAMRYTPTGSQKVTKLAVGGAVDLGTKTMWGNTGLSLANTLIQGLIGNRIANKTKKMYEDMSRKSTYIPSAREHIVYIDESNAKRDAVRQANAAANRYIDVNTSSSKVAANRRGINNLNMLQGLSEIENYEIGRRDDARNAEAQLQSQYNLTYLQNKINDIRESNDFETQRQIGITNSLINRANTWGQSIAQGVKDISGAFTDRVNQLYTLADSKNKDIAQPAIEALGLDISKRYNKRDSNNYANKLDITLNPFERIAFDRNNNYIIYNWLTGKRRDV